MKDLSSICHKKIKNKNKKKKKKTLVLAVSSSTSQGRIEDVNSRPSEIANILLKFH